LYSWKNGNNNVGNDDDHHVNHDALGDGGRRRIRNNSRVEIGRRRGGSFDLDLDYHDDELPRPQQPRDVNDIDINFDMLGNEINHHVGGLGRPKPLVKNTGDDYGCEVLTFGRADHCALGVLGGGGGGVGGLMGSTIGCHKPKRVEAFGLGDLRRNWSSSSSSSSSPSLEDSQYKDDDVISSAVAVAASTHHTLVLTRTGRLFAFGYGKSGRLGTGDASNRPLPVRILGRLTRRVVTGIAAAEDHSLCCTDDGAVFSWGSNGFGQLGHSLGRGSGGSIDNQNNDNDAAIVASRMSPRRVEAGGMKQSFVVSVAAGDRHSVALTRLGEVYCWGDNRSGQLGIYSNTGDVGSGRCCHNPQRVEVLWTARPSRRAIAVAASEFSTLVLTEPPTMSGGEGQASLSSLPVNTVYGWGHGNPSVMRVEFPTTTARSSTQQADIYARSTGINPIAIASAKFHNVAITLDGEVFTWGIQKDSLGNEKSPAAVGASKRFDSEWATASENRRPRSNSNTGLGSKTYSSSSVISSPQLVMGMLPENGGGKAVAVSASESHTAIVTADGYLFTWGTSTEKDVMGHRGVNWLQTPRKVKRVHRAVGVAAAKEHTVLLMATTFPPLPFANPTCSDTQPLSLQECAAIEISRNVDLFNVLPIALVARRLNCRPLMHFCDEFTRKNLDGVLAVGNKNDFTTFITSVRSAYTGGVRSDFDLDGPYHPFFYQLANFEIEDGNLLLLNKYARSIMPSQKKVKKKLVREEQRPSSCKEKKVDEIASNQSCVVAKVDTKKTAQSSDKKSVRVSFLEGEGDGQLMPPTKLFHDKGVIMSNTGCAVADTSKFRCEVCNVSCPDNDSYTLHMTGRKHRNRLMHANKEEEKRVAEAMMEMKRMQLMEKMCNDDENNNIAVSNDTTLKDKKPKSAWGNAVIKPSVQKVRTKSFQEILLEEQQRSLKSNEQPKGTMSTPTTFEQPRLSNALAPTISGPSLTLSAFIKQSGGRIVGNPVTPSATKMSAKKVNSVGPTGWGAKQDVTEQPKPTATKSFSEIQQEEEAFRSNEDHMCRIEGNQWFVAQRERAASIGEIQEQEKKDREMQERIEEQKQIERDIMDRVRRERTNVHIKRPRKKRHVHKSGNENPTKNLEG
jgi:alpha-tubulin suppressor-like RCC1 family protein